jgi:putative DNA primase/helicase
MANVYADISSNALKITGRFKILCGGERLKAERKFQKPFYFYNTAKLIFSTNTMPKTSDVTDAFFRRWIIINFPNQFTKPDKHLIDKLTTPEELSGLLNIALTNLKKLQQTGTFSTNMTTDEVRQYYQKLSDPLFAFLEDCCQQGHNQQVSKSDLYSGYVLYCENNKLTKTNQSQFTKELKKHVSILREERPQIDGVRVRVWKGIGLLKQYEKKGPSINDNTCSQCMHWRTESCKKFNPQLIMPTATYAQNCEDFQSKTEERIDS